MPLTECCEGCTGARPAGVDVSAWEGCLEQLGLDSQMDAGATEVVKEKCQLKGGCNSEAATVDPNCCDCAGPGRPDSAERQKQLHESGQTAAIADSELLAWPCALQLEVDVKASDTEWKAACLRKEICNAENMDSNGALDSEGGPGGNAKPAAMAVVNEKMPRWDMLNNTAWGRKVRRRKVLMGNVDKYLAVKSAALAAQMGRRQALRFNIRRSLQTLKRTYLSFRRNQVRRTRCSANYASPIAVLNVWPFLLPTQDLVNQKVLGMDVAPSVEGQWRKLDVASRKQGEAQTYIEMVFNAVAEYAAQRKVLPRAHVVPALAH